MMKPAFEHTAAAEQNAMATARRHLEAERNQLLIAKVFSKADEAEEGLTPRAYRERNAAVRLKKGDVSPPWPSRLGYVVVRLNNARLGGLEDVYDDLEDATRTEFYETYFKLWVNETLSGSEVVIP